MESPLAGDFFWRTISRYRCWPRIARWYRLVPWDCILVSLAVRGCSAGFLRVCPTRQRSITYAGVGECYPTLLSALSAGSGGNPFGVFPISVARHRASDPQAIVLGLLRPVFVGMYSAIPCFFGEGALVRTGAEFSAILAAFERDAALVDCGVFLDDHRYPVGRSPADFRKTFWKALETMPPRVFRRFAGRSPGPSADGTQALKKDL